MANDVQDLLSKLNGMAQPQPDDTKQDPGSGDVGPSVGDEENELVTLDMTEAEVEKWWGRVDRMRARRKAREEAWDILLDEYLPIVSKSGSSETVKVQAHFRNVHTKMGGLFYRSPDLVLTPDDPGPGNNPLPAPPAQPGQPPPPPMTMADVISLKQAVLKKKLGRDGIKVHRLMDELIFDVLTWAGVGCCKIGYQATMGEKPTMMPDPNFQPPPNPTGSILGLQPTPQAPMIQATHPQTGAPLTEPTPIYEEYYARRFSPKKALWNDDLRSTRFDEDATIMGMEFFISPKKAMRVFKLTSDEASKASEDDLVHEYPEDKQGGTTAPGLIRCVELWVKASVFTDTQPHPLALNQLILVEGIRNRPIVWRPSPDQTFDEVGRLTPDSLAGFPIKVLTIRDLADSCFPPSDSAMTNSEIKQLSTWRRQSIRLRDASIGKFLYDVDAFDTTEVDQLKNGEIGEFIPVMPGKMQQGVDKIFAQTSKIQGSADDQRGFMGIKQDMNETLGIGANQSGTETDTVRTATEAKTVATAIQSRNDKELGRVVDLYLDIARGLDQLLMRYMTEPEYVEIGGDDAASKMHAFNNKTISGRYLYDIAPDSQLRPDSAQDFNLLLNFYNLTAKDQLANRSYILKRLARMRGLDPAKAVVPPPPPPPPKQDMVSVSLALTTPDLTNQAVMEFLTKIGAINQPMPPLGMQPPHGGPLTPGEVISHHLDSNSGKRPNEPGAGNHREGQVK